MSRRNLTILSMIFTLLIIMLLRQQGPPTEEGPSLAVPSIKGFDGVEIQRFGLERITLKKITDTWFLQPGNRPLSARVSKQLHDTFAQPLHSDYAVDLTDLDPRDFSVTEAATVVTLKKGNEVIMAFRMGKVVDGKSTFIRKPNESTAYRINTNLRQLFDRQPIDWRERRVIGLQANDVQGIKCSGKGFKDWSIARETSETDWQMTVPKSMLVSQAVANSMANTIATVRAESFHEKLPFQPQLAITLRTFSGASIILELAAEDEDGNRLARDANGLVFLIPRHQAMFTAPTIDILRNRRLFKFSPDDAVELIFSGPPRIHLRKQPDQSWSMVAPQAKRRLSHLVMDSALSQISGLQTVGFPNRPQPDPMKRVYAELSIQLIDERQVTVTLGGTFNETKARYAESTVHPGELYVLPHNAIKAIQPTVEDLLIEAK